MRLCPWGTTILFLCFECQTSPRFRAASDCHPRHFIHSQCCLKYHSALCPCHIFICFRERSVLTIQKETSVEQYTTAWPHLLVLCGQSVTTADIRFLVQQSPECIPGPSFISSPMALGLLSQRRLDWKLPAAALSLSQPGFFSSPNIISQQAKQHREKVQFSSGVHGTGTKPRNRRRLQLSGHPQVRGKVA